MSWATRSHNGALFRCLVALALALAELVLVPWPAQAQATPGSTTITITAPAAAQLGHEIPLQAHLTTASGAPIAKVTVYFVNPATFLNVTGNAVIAESVTDANGLATATWRVTRNGGLTIQAEFDGNTRYAASRATAKLDVTGEQQLYTQEAGVPIPGLNAAPRPSVSFFAALWPRLSAWPIAAALLVVWSMYATVAALLFRIAAAGARVPGRAKGQP